MTNKELEKKVDRLSSDVTKLKFLLRVLLKGGISVQFGTEILESQKYIAKTIFEFMDKGEI